ncbi:rab effector MyRIP-like [Babylonia areolata]|uniref:rab effector MyRIP-like n=1 Tax=Babylonia areolata TaxID=304850 RepID=UPI003FD15E80
MEGNLTLSCLTEDECEKIVHVLEKDFELRQTERERLEFMRKSLMKEEDRTQVLAQQTNFNRNFCIRCCQVFGLVFRRRRRCCNCGYNVCSSCCSYLCESKEIVCHFCAKQKDYAKQTSGWFYDRAGRRFQRTASAKVIRYLYRSSSYSLRERGDGKQ